MQGISGYLDPGRRGRDHQKKFHGGSQEIVRVMMLRRRYPSGAVAARRFTGERQVGR